ncbi:superoxide dismutase family protein [Fluoribacter dumoffii]|uniref:Superoxide dismutase [Cu-Zn] n=1 Tax=Fluoribacter dumoffii TaxID=463 RepID=A0A377GCS9_9GAMM|nr:superoxide dismutase family protein [Fluoribacter dumoffii]KTC90630.1 superoxide dismutase, Cu, Zn [Fluoribacter dumoffii NY 23]MCW8386309.1 superoxide dismutase family protein [Fluoribacter dumoffii]MCW8419362.1 superoxide dismutase family protein [Fluoribacter dumoffii]MCW8452763.1 superoxide dismutase family protein [Fluoribacter dumoffii]MCW8459987.1 superoxide dismutase family protein [Fluoribacter dumoffii]
MKKSQQKKQTILGTLALFAASVAFADTVTSEVSTTAGASVGKIVFEDSKYGLLIKPQLTGLPAGIHGFHIHQHPDCGDHAKNAGGHLDPANTNKHLGPYGEGHLGDLPVLVVDPNGTANIIVLAPRLKTQDIKDHAIMIHEGGDNYSDNPPLGGGGERIACGKIS